MLRVLVVDDEKIVRIALSTIIKWQENGFELIGTVADGLQALEAIANNKPDIVITDLKMPNMDGLELIRILREREFEGKIVVLSNFGDYELVRDAMKLGAVDYLLKVTLKPNELLSVLVKATELLSEERKRSENNFHIRVELNEKQLLQRNHMWIELLQEDEKYLDDALKTTEKFGVSADKLVGHLIYIKIDRYEQALTTGRIKNKKLLNFSVANIIKEAISDRCAIELVENGDGHYTVIVNELDKKEEVNWISLANNLIQLMSLYLNLSISVALSESFNGFVQLREQFAKCRQAAAGTFYMGPGSVIMACKLNFQTTLSLLNHTEWSNELKNLIEEGDVTRLSDSLAAIMIEMREVMCDPVVLKQSILVLLTDLDNMIVKWERKTGSSEVKMRDSSYTLPEFLKRQVMKAETFEDFHSSVEQSLQEAVLRLQQVKSRNCRKEVLRVIHIMQERLDDKVTLEMLANEVNMNISYLCRVFKQDTGKSIVQYLNELKINYAVELLKQPDVRVKEVSALVGIDDPFYFNRLFKKTLGMSPSDFRKRLLLS